MQSKIEIRILIEIILILYSCHLRTFPNLSVKRAKVYLLHFNLLIVDKFESFERRYLDCLLIYNMDEETVSICLLPTSFQLPSDFHLFYEMKSNAKFMVWWPGEFEH